MDCAFMFARLPSPKESMKTTQVIALVAAIVGTQAAHAGVTPSLGALTALPLLEGGLMGVAVAALVVGVRIVRAKSKR